MKNKAILLIVIIVLISILLATPAFAHSGGTDSNGGHYNHDTGEYHYHHGYSAHKQTNGVCPYERTTPIIKNKPSIGVFIIIVIVLAIIARTVYRRGFLLNDKRTKSQTNIAELLIPLAWIIISLVLAFIFYY